MVLPMYEGSLLTVHQGSRVMMALAYGQYAGLVWPLILFGEVISFTGTTKYGKRKRI